MIEVILKNLKHEQNLTDSQIKAIKVVMASYACDAVMDSKVWKEAEEIVNKNSDPNG